MEKIRFVDGGVTAPRGFTAAGLACGIKKSGAPDLALVMSATPSVTAGVFTTSRVKAHPVLDARAKLAAGRRIRGILVNSGSANACTGDPGMRDLRLVLGALSRAAGIPEESLLMSSTGVIGERLPTGAIVAALTGLSRSLSAEGHEAASRAIMTTDTYPKECAVALETPGGTVTIGGMAKGAGMINPNMATMLAFVTTDAKIGGRRALATQLRRAADRTFNRIDLDGDTSTNDSLFLMAGGASGIDPLKEHGELFAEGLYLVCDKLARMVAGDTEGATKLATVRVTGAADGREAELAARTVAESSLVKTALHGQDPNWGRIMAALGRSGAEFDPERTSITVNGCPLVRGGVKNPAVSEAEARAALVPREILLEIDLAGGSGSCDILTGDLTAEYVRINASYRS